MEVLLDVLDTLPGQPPSPPDYNLETIYATVVGIIFVFSAVWYLFFLRQDLFDAFWQEVRSTLGDWLPARSLICEKEVKDTKRTCNECGKEFDHGVIIACEDYCAQCSLSPNVFKKAQEAYTKKEEW